MKFAQLAARFSRIASAGWIVAWTALAPSLIIAHDANAEMWGLRRALRSQAPAVLIDSKPACDPCTWTITHVARLGSPNDADGPNNFSKISVTSTGHYIVAPSFSRTKILEYDRNGHLLRSFGTEGEGPGEFKRIENARAVRGDSILVVDDELGRVTLLSPAGKYVRSISTGGRLYDGAVMKNGDFLIQGGIPTRDRIGFTLHRGTFPARTISSFGPQHTSDGSETMVTLRAPMAVQKGSVWVAMYNEYRIERWDIAAQQVQAVFKRNAEWFPIWRAYSIGGIFTDKPVPQLSSISVDDNNRLWVKVAVADRSWPPKVTAAQIEESNHSPMMELGDKVFDTVIEVLDANTGKLLATHSFDQHFMALIGNGLVTSMTQNPDGEFITDVWKLSYSQTPKPRSNSAGK